MSFVAQGELSPLRRSATTLHDTIERRKRKIAALEVQHCIMCRTEAEASEAPERQLIQDEFFADRCKMAEEEELYHAVAAARTARRQQLAATIETEPPAIEQQVQPQQRSSAVLPARVALDEVLAELAALDPTVRRRSRALPPAMPPLRRATPTESNGSGGKSAFYRPPSATVSRTSIPEECLAAKATAAPATAATKHASLPPLVRAIADAIGETGSHLPGIRSQLPAPSAQRPISTSIGKVLPCVAHCSLEISEMRNEITKALQFNEHCSLITPPKHRSSSAQARRRAASQFCAMLEASEAVRLNVILLQRFAYAAVSWRVSLGKPASRIEQWFRSKQTSLVVRDRTRRVIAMKLRHKNELQSRYFEAFGRFLGYRKLQKTVGKELCSWLTHRTLNELRANYLYEKISRFQRDIFIRRLARYARRRRSVRELVILTERNQRALARPFYHTWLEITALKFMAPSQPSQRKKKKSPNCAAYVLQCKAQLRHQKVSWARWVSFYVARAKLQELRIIVACAARQIRAAKMNKKFAEVWESVTAQPKMKVAFDKWCLFAQTRKSKP